MVSHNMRRTSPTGISTAPTIMLRKKHNRRRAVQIMNFSLVINIITYCRLFYYRQEIFWFAKSQFGMGDGDEVAQETFGMEGRVLVERAGGGVAAIRLILAHSLEFAVSALLRQQLVVGYGVGGIVAEQPEIGIEGFLEDTLEGESHRTAMRIVFPGIVDGGIGEHTSEGALSAGDIPNAADKFVHEDRMMSVTTGFLPECQIVSFYFGKEAVGFGFGADKHAVEAHPLGTTEGRGFHVVSHLDDGNAEVFNSSVATAVLEG